MLHCKDIDIEYFKKLSNLFITKSLSRFYLNICSLQNLFGNVHILINE